MFKIEDIMTKDVITANRKTEIQEAIRIIVENNITGLPVVDDNMKLVGIISEKDVMTLLYNVGSRTGRVEDFMTTRKIVSFDIEDNLVDVCDCLLKNHFRRVPIVQGPKKKLVGIITRKNIVQRIFECQDFFRDTPHKHNKLVGTKV
ncbi:MAG: CBS domain-containing protein [Planctomycetes bacterium]|nr:CBS domain-containing protein [Planctomycetota bacterium]